MPIFRNASKKPSPKFIYKEHFSIKKTLRNSKLIVVFIVIVGILIIKNVVAVEYIEIKRKEGIATRTKKILGTI